jgi:hypothetical protein
MPDPHSILPLKKRIKHVVVLGKHHIIEVDGVDDVEAYNNYDEMSLFTDFTKTHCPRNEKVLRGSCYGEGLASLCKCVCL